VVFQVNADGWMKVFALCSLLYWWYKSWMMTEMDIETSVYYVHLTRLIAQEDFIKFTRRESTKTYIELEDVCDLNGTIK
jgi:hypothetical protein